MIEKSNLMLLFEELDKILSSENLKRELVIYGGAALIAHNHSERATVDVDVFEPKLDAELIKAIQSVGRKNKLIEDWVNSTGQAFQHELPKGWPDRLETIFNGESLSIKTLGRIDLIFTKALAELDRQEDLADLLFLAPTKSELAMIKTPLLNAEPSSEWKKKVHELLLRLEKASHG